VSNYYKDAASPSGPPDGAQVDLVDFSGRVALVTFILAKRNVPAVIGGLIRSFLDMGGSREDLLAAVDLATKPKTQEAFHE
jgi:hypothetical protein